MVSWVNAMSCWAVRSAQTFMKSAPASGRASFAPPRSGRWQLAQCVRYASSPAAACCAVKGAGGACAPAVPAPSIKASQPARATACAPGRTATRREGSLCVVISPIYRNSQPQRLPSGAASL